MEASSPPIARRVWCVIPVFNNRSTLAAVAQACRRELEHVLVVDDGSTDADVAALLRGTDVTVLRHAHNLGKGCALITALQYVQAQGGEFMITVDADGQHDPRDIHKFLPLLAAEPAAIVVGARQMDAPNVPASSRFGMRFSDFWLRLETGCHIRDSQSGFRSYPVGYVSRLKLRGRRYDFEVEALAKAAWAGLPIRAVDVGVTYAGKGERISHFRPVLDNLRISHCHITLLARRLLPWPHRRLLKREAGPKGFFLHPLSFLRGLLLEHATPGELAVSAGVGTFLATLPLLSFHTVAIIYVTTRLHLNRLMAVAIQNLCAPPFVPFVCIELGHFLRHGRWLHEMSRQTLWHQAPARLLEWLLGSLVAAPILAAVTGFLVFGIAILAQQRWGAGKCQADA